MLSIVKTVQAIALLQYYCHAVSTSETHRDDVTFLSSQQTDFVESWQLVQFQPRHIHIAYGGETKSGNNSQDGAQLNANKSFSFRR